MATAIYNAGVVFGEMGNYSQALKYFDRSITINPKEADAWYNIGYVLDHLQKFSDALKAYNTALKFFPSTSINLQSQWNGDITLAVISYHLGKFSDSVKAYNAMLTLVPKLFPSADKDKIQQTIISGKEARNLAVKERGK